MFHYRNLVVKAHKRAVIKSPTDNSVEKEEKKHYEKQGEKVKIGEDVKNELERRVGVGDWGNRNTDPNEKKLGWTKRTTLLLNRDLFVINRKYCN